MYQDLNEHKRSDTIKWIIAFMAIILLAAGVVAALVPIYFPTKDSTEKEVQTEEVKSELNCDDFVFETYAEQGILLSSGPMMASASNDCVTKQLKATIAPSNAQNKAVDWSVAWADKSKTESVTNYVTVTPTMDGSLTAEVACYKAFSGDIIVTVKSREGGLSAECVVTFVGYPSALSISGSNIQSNAEIGNYYGIGAGNDYNFTLTPTNIFNQVGADCNYTVAVTGYGQIATQMWSVRYNAWNGSLVDTSDEVIVDISTITQINSETPGFFFDCSVSGNTLSIHGNASLESYYGGTHTGSDPRAGTFQDNKFKYYVDDTWYFEVKVTETNSGVSQTIKVRPFLTVTSVSLSANEMTF